MPIGQLTRVLPVGGCGFIRTSGEGPDIYVDRQQLVANRIRIGDVVEFALAFDYRGRPRARQLRKVAHHTKLSVWETIPEVASRLKRQSTVQNPVVGRVKSLHDKGFGFLQVDGPAPNIFFHLSAIYGRAPREGDLVEFRLRFDAEERPRAEQVRVIQPTTQISHWDDISAVRERRARELFAEAIVLRDDHEYAAAREKLHEAIHQFPQKFYFDALASVERQIGNNDRVREVYRWALEFFPSDVSLFEGLAVAERRAGDLSAAKSLLLRGINQAPAYTSLHFHLATVLVDIAEQKGDFDELGSALEHLRISTTEGEDASKLQQRIQVLTQPRSRMLWMLLKRSGFEISSWSVKSDAKSGMPIECTLTAVPPSGSHFESYGLVDPLMAYCSFEPKTSERHVNRALHLLSHTAENPINKDVLLIGLSGVSALRPYLVRQLENPEKNAVVVPVDEITAPSVIIETSEQDYLRQLLDEWLFRRDLYKGNFPVSGRRFFGRERELQILSKNIDEGRSTGVFGLRRVGKTSLLYQVQLIRGQDLIAYVEPEAAPSDDCKFLCWRAVNDWAGRASEAITLRLSECNYPTFGSLPSFEEVLSLFDEDVRTLLASLNSGARLVVMIDEVEKIIPSIHSKSGWNGLLPFFRYVRGISQEKSGRFVFIVAGANPGVCEEPLWVNQDNPIFQFVEEMFLPLLTESDCAEMVVKLGEGMGMDYDEDAQRAIYSSTGGHPFLTRKFCSRLSSLYQNRPLRVLPSMVREAEAEALIHDEAIFEEIVSRLDRDFPDELEVLRAIIEGKSGSEIRTVVPAWSRALRHLQGYQLIERDPERSGALRIKIRLFETWLRERRSSK